MFDQSPEPAPEWETALIQWGKLWDIHIYLFGIIFAMMTFWNIWSLTNLLCSTNHRSPRRAKKCFATINVLIIYYNLVRCINLLVDQYQSDVNQLTKSRGVSFLLWGISIPCFTASFMLIHFVLLETTKLQLYSKKLQSLKFIAGIVGTHFTLVVTVDIIVILHPTMNSMLLICQIFLVCIGFSVFCSALFTGVKVIRHIKSTERRLQNFRSQNTLVSIQAAQDNVSINSGVGLNLDSSTISSFQGRSVKDKAIFRMTIITMVTALCGLMYCVLQIYSLSVVFNLQNNKRHPEPWHWFGYESGSRVVEIGMVCCMSYIARAPFYSCRVRRSALYR